MKNLLKLVKTGVLVVAATLFFGKAQATPQTGGVELAIIDSELPGNQILVDNLKEGVIPVFLSKKETMINSITNVIGQYSNIKSLHLFVHGTNKGLFTSYSGLMLNDVTSNTSKIEGWKSSFASEASILIYACDLASGTEGKEIVNKLNEYTGAGVAASTNKTGHISMGGDWNLEYKAGNPTLELAVKESVKESFSYTLGKIFLYHDASPWGSGNVTNLGTEYTNLGHDVTIQEGGDIPDLSTYHLVWIIQPTNALSAASITSLEAFLNRGGRIVFMGEHGGFTPDQNNNISTAVVALGGHFSIVNESMCGAPSCGDDQKASGTLPDHFILDGVTTFYSNYMAPISMGGEAEILMKAPCNDQKVYMAREVVSNGDMVMWADQNWFDDIANTACNDNRVFINNLLLSAT